MPRDNRGAYTRLDSSGNIDTGKIKKLSFKKICMYGI